MRVKRAEVGEPVALTDGRGHTARARITEILKDRKTGEWSMAVAIEAVEDRERVSPRVEVWAAAPKGPRLEAMIDGLSQAGASSWSPLHTERTVVEPREHKLERMHRLAAEASKQCGRAWHLEIGAGGDLEAAIAASAGASSTTSIAGAGVPPASSLSVIIADASGVPYRSSGASTIRLLIGPEGGWAPRELARARERGAVVAAFGPHVMRVETAAVVACGIILDSEIRLRNASGGTRS